MNSITYVDDIPYIAGLILRLDYSDFEMIPKSEIEYTKALILVNSGAVCSNKIHASDIHRHQDVLNDYVENFKALYPHYFDNIHPAFMWVSGVVAMGEMSYN